MLEEYTIPALIIVFCCGFLIGLNLGMICAKNGDYGETDAIPRYALRRDNLPVRYPGDNHRQSLYNNNNYIGANSWSNNNRPVIEPSGKRRMFNINLT